MCTWILKVIILIDAVLRRFLLSEVIETLLFCRNNSTFTPADTVAIVFCSTHKSLTLGKSGDKLVSQTTVTSMLCCVEKKWFSCCFFCLNGFGFSDKYCYQCDTNGRIILLHKLNESFLQGRERNLLSWDFSGCTVRPPDLWKAVFSFLFLFCCLIQCC